MIRDITIGQYYRAVSPIHKLDPRVKIAGTFFYMISLFIGKNIINYLIAALVLVIVIKISKVPMKFIVRGLKPMLFLLLFSVALNMLFIDGNILVKFGFLKITDQGIITALFLGCRLVLLVLGSSVLTLTTTPKQLTDGIDKMFGCLNKIGVPVHEVAMMMSIALRFIPILTEELDIIMKAQMSRGADLESGNLLQKIKALVPILVPLFVSAIRRANDLALSMEARCYGGSIKRTKMKPLIYKNRDFAGYVLILIYMGIMILSTIFCKNVGWMF